MVARPRPAVKDDLRPILKELEHITSRGYSPWPVFDDWLALMLFALMRNDDEYLKIVRRYRNEGERGAREIDRFANAFGLLMQQMQLTNRELLGEIYEAWDIANKHAGQFFTPWTVCEFMAQIIGAPGPGQTISDPCCGSGRMLIATCRQMTSEALRTAVFVAQDVDITCVMMTALNFTFFNLNGEVILGNSLSLEVNRVFQTTRSSIGGSVREIPAEDLPQPVPEEVRKEAIIKPLQQSLFT